MIVAITGTPGTGKSSVAGKLSEITGWELTGLNELAEKKGLYSGYDEGRKCHIVDMEALKKEVSEMRHSERPLIIESHYAHDMPADLIIVLRASPGELKERGLRKGWSRKKAQENAEAEIMEVCRGEAAGKVGDVMEFDTSGKDAHESAREIAGMLELEGLFVSHELRLTQAIREELRKPYGKLFKSIKGALSYMKGSRVISVGDRVSYDMHSAKKTPEIMVIDGKIRRMPAEKKLDIECRTIRAKNRAGYLSKELWLAAQDALSSEKPVKIEVEGEDDMAVLPMMLLAPKGMSIIYGLFDRGMCVIRSGREARKTAREVLKRIAASQ